jgi:hypothetical protein
VFGDQLILQGLWPQTAQPFSIRFLFMGCLKRQVYDSSPQSIETNSEDEISKIDHDTLHWVACNMVKQMDACIWERASQFQHLL